MTRDDLLTRAFVVGAFFGAAFALTFTIGMNNVASYLISVPILAVITFFCNRYFKRLIMTKTSADRILEPNQLSVVPASEPLQKSGTRPILKIKILLRGRPIGYHTFTFNKDVITVGRDPQSDIRIDSVNVGHEHLRFEFAPSGYYKLVDLGSGKGTFLNDEQVTRGYVYNNDVVRIGQYTLWIGFQADSRVNVG